MTRLIACATLQEDVAGLNAGFFLLRTAKQIDRLDL